MQTRNLLLFGIISGLVAAGYAHASTHLFRRWGATDAELAAPLAGDDLVAQPRWQLTHAVTIDAPPDAVWPWLVQMGYQRGGLYSYDTLDIWAGVLDAPSADHVLPEFQDLRPGDVIPLGFGPDWPVAAVEAECALLLAPDVSDIPETAVSWVFVLQPRENGTTRLLTRVRAQYPRKSSTALIMPMMDPAAFLMTRRMLLGIKQRAEQLAYERCGAAPATSRAAA